MDGGRKGADPRLRGLFREVFPSNQEVFSTFGVGVVFYDWLE